MYVIGTAGHVDHGKSVLVQALTGIDPDRLRGRCSFAHPLPSPNDPSPEGLWPAGRSSGFAQAGDRSAQTNFI